MKEYLQVKVRSLIDEARFIRYKELETKYMASQQRARHLEGKAFTDRFETANRGLHLHRIVDVRKEARSSHLAYGFIKGRKYRQMEPLAYHQPDWDRIERLVMKYSEFDSRLTAQKFAEWKAEALGNVQAKYISSIQPGSHRGRWTPWMHESRRLQAGVAEGVPLSTEQLYGGGERMTEEELMKGLETAGYVQAK